MNNKGFKGVRFLGRKSQSRRDRIKNKTKDERINNEIDDVIQRILSQNKELK